MDDAPARKPIRVTIFNQSYSLIASDEPGQVEELAHTVDELMHEVAVKAGNVDTARTAVLTCLHLADQKRNLEKEIEQLRQRVAAKARQFSVRLDQALTGSQNESL